ncbi:ankyrin repeat domain-containing protein [Gemmata sp.]|uniref:ankyrin repeat domain-containing protein n=1 Tax=Gemmata sp. TaxID=1914242 RepID=UPI003F72FABA
MTPAQEMFAAVEERDAPRVAALLDKHPQLCDLAEKTGTRSSILHMAASAGHLDLVELLAVAGATLDKQDASGFAPLHYAANNGHLAIVKVLVEAGARLRIWTNGGLRPLDQAELAGQQDVANFLRAAMVSQGLALHD